MTLRIGIDAWPLTRHPTGIGRYVRELCVQLAVLFPDAEFLLYSPRPVVLPQMQGWRHHADARSFLPGNLWLKWRLGTACARDQLDVFWATRTLLPALPPSVATISTVHDLNYRIAPETMQLANLWAHRLWFRSDVRRASAVAANSQGTSDRLAQLVGRCADAIVRPAASAQYRRPSMLQLAATLERHNLKRPYLLSVGTQEPRKNLCSLIEAHATLRSRDELPHELVIVGSKGWGTHRSLMEGSGNVRWLGYVPEPDLPALYAGAAIFVFPSLYEGFGMPVLEARACGARIVASDIPEIREAGGTGALYVEPTVDGLRDGIERVLKAPDPAVPDGTLPSWQDSASILASQLMKVARG